MRIAKLFLLILLLSVVRTDSLLAEFDLNVLSEAYRKEIAEVLDEAGGNREELLLALTRATSEGYLDAASFLICQMKANNLDAFHINGQTLIEHIEYAYKAKQAVPYSVPEDLFFNYILNYRILNEPVETWRKELYNTFFPLIKGISNVRQAALIINEWVAKRMQKIGPQMLTGAPLQILKAGRGDEEEICTFTVAILRSLAIPSRMAYVLYLGEQSGGKTWVEIYAQDRWIPFYPSHPENLGDFGKLEEDHPHNITKAFARPYVQKVDRTPNYTQTGRIVVSIAEADDPVSVAANVFNDGVWFPVQQALTDGQGLATFQLGEGDYLVAVGEKNGRVFLESLAVRSHRTVRYDLNLTSGKSRISE